MAKLSPMMIQYNEIKSRYKDCILFFRLGDFYEMFFEDALTASRELEITLTGRDCGLEERAPMCGVPHHSCEAYIKRLIDKGYKVAICEQLTNPAATKGMVKRDVVRIITPGTIIESGFLDESRNNYICSIFVQKKGYGISFADVSTGEVYVTQSESGNLQQGIIDEISKFNPSEVLYNGYFVKLTKASDFLRQRVRCLAELMPDEKYDINICIEQIESYFGKQKTQPLRGEDAQLCAKSLGVLLSYLDYTQRHGAKRMVNLNIYKAQKYLSLDIYARRNLELCETMRSKEKKGTLLWVLDETSTAMGKRLLRKFIEQPLVNPAEIISRQNAVEEIYLNFTLLNDLKQSLKYIYDLERLLTKAVFGSVNPRELYSLGATAGNIPAVKKCIAGCESSLLKTLYGAMDELSDIRELIFAAISEKAPVAVKDGGVINEGYNSELDELRSIFKNAKGYLAEIEKKEKEKTGIKNLRIGYNRVFGYYIEVSKGNISLVPDEYIRKQTLTNCERYITEELKALESKVLTAEEKIYALEQSIFDEVVKYTSAQMDRIQQTANSAAMLDVLCSLACVASENNYVKPEISADGVIDIKDGRHPVVEKMLEGVPFVPNDIYLNGTSNRTAVITGPNMAGKSTYMRQTALITLMAQMGSFVPARSAHIGIVDKIFTRVGASDDLSSGRSTFMVEMSEVAHILKNATSNSLIILDEIGRGTSTFDGMSIAKAVVENISKTKKARTLFATHYHELTDMENEFEGVNNYNIAAKKHGDEVVFLRKIVKGAADDSYGIEVAQLAGVPSQVVKRAREILAELEAGKYSEILAEKHDKTPQMKFDTASDLLKEKLVSVDPNVLSPIEALNLVYELKKLSEN